MIGKFNFVKEDEKMRILHAIRHVGLSAVTKTLDQVQLYYKIC